MNRRQQRTASNPATDHEAGRSSTYRRADTLTQRSDHIDRCTEGEPLSGTSATLLLNLRVREGACDNQSPIDDSTREHPSDMHVGRVGRAGGDVYE